MSAETMNHLFLVLFFAPFTVPEALEVFKNIYGMNECVTAEMNE